MSEPVPRKPKYQKGALRLLILSRGMTILAGMNALQNQGLISDNCVEVDDVALPDVERLLVRAGKLCFLSREEKAIMEAL